ncbi:deoxyribodipyrimidine photolyase-related protein [Novosphingobium nitrogenifigens DSM 19370]|uniref:Deoxyribodipyrimidine photolyase-related protein n=1 Tax=Novosphingobium nitrogenifigens DSM 19370 TaxID=983920 RepID=F1Z8N4_9SPHN|nr:cryptochrome/photolyase family protein [Novosphingobium nitrogenifigens]EGD58991.1 deoxyribodipyrimidine photolyase-related protein [Novosphingobium nitrogenifigens DSM 19370]
MHAIGPVLVPVLGDQLSPAISSLSDRTRKDTVVLMMEVGQETGYVRHHQAKIALILSAMRHFAQDLRADGWQVDYVRLDDPDNTHSFSGEVERAARRHRARGIQVTEPGEWRVRAMMHEWSATLGLRVRIMPDTRFICPLPDFFQWAAGRSELRMEWFYRTMRRKTGLLMDGDKPVGGRWNFDAENRSGPEPGLSPPALPRFTPHSITGDAITRDVLDLVSDRFGDHFGSLDAFGWPVTRQDAETLLDHFIERCLPHFGHWQDAMMAGHDTMFHSLLAPAINLGLLDPLAVCRRAEAAYRSGQAPIAAVEGFIRQIIGWREYVRGMYWLDMPGLAGANALDAQRPLPEFWWTGQTPMRCLAETVRSTRENAYAHHIQRLMVMGNFALLAGLRPQEVADWFLAVYADAFEWVELPNVAGMALHADGGRLASKPYAASGAYIDRMSDYCGACRYDVKRKTGPDACPFNALYWHFLDRNADRLSGNPRLAYPYATWARMSPEKRAETLASAEAFLATLQPAAPGWARSQDCSRSSNACLIARP